MKKLNLLFILSVTIIMMACNDSETTSSVIVSLTDSPGDYEKVYIDLQSVQVHVNSEAEDQDAGWQTLDSNAGVYDLLELTNGVSTVIADDQFPTGRISQMRLVLGENNSVVVDGEEHALNVPSGSESGLKIQINADLVAGITYSVLVDFDAAKSVVATGSGKYNLKPVIKAVTEAVDGAVKGIVLPAEESVAVYALVGDDTVSTSYAVENNSDYFLGGLSSGTYKISFDPGELSGYAGIVIEDVSVAVGEVTTLDDITLTLK